jgi:serine protease inhibitor
MIVNNLRQRFKQDIIYVSKELVELKTWLSRLVLMNILYFSDEHWNHFDFRQSVQATRNFHPVVHGAVQPPWYSRPSASYIPDC